MQVEVYLNIRKNKLSIRYKGTVIDHTDQITLADPVFRVQPAGRERVRKTGYKNVHAYIKGEWLTEAAPLNWDWNAATYNPYKHDHFVDTETQQPIHKANYALIQSDGKILYA